ncbi:MAG: hypothetical protein ACI86M_002558 [Saprospiraceae bacterium]|jgi:hypothetical protein
MGLAVGGALGYFVCNQSRGSQNLHSSNLISNSDARSMIEARRAQSPYDPFSSHLEIGVLLSYIHDVQERCDVIGAEFSGLEYYFANHSERRPSSWNEGSLTTVICPTYKSGENHIPFDPYLSSDTSKLGVLDIKSNLLKHGSSAHVLNRANMSPPKQPYTY